MQRFTLIIALATVAIFAAGVFIFSRNSTSNSKSTPLPLPSAYEYFWGDGCPHCANVEEFIETWENKDKVNVEKKEVWYNKANANLMTQRAQSCGLSLDNLGVPFLFTPDGKCINGDEPIIDFFKNLKIGN